jgi:hypothetical protein
MRRSSQDAPPASAPSTLHFLACPPPTQTHRRALVPTMHASDLGSAKALRKFKPGQTVAGRVLTVDPGEPRWLRLLVRRAFPARGAAFAACFQLPPRRRAYSPPAAAFVAGLHPCAQAAPAGGPSSCPPP